MESKFLHLLSQAIIVMRSKVLVISDRYTGRAGIFYSYVDGGTITDNNVVSNSYEGIDIESCNSIIVKDNIVKNSKGGGNQKLPQSVSVGQGTNILQLQAIFYLPQEILHVFMSEMLI